MRDKKKALELLGAKAGGEKMTLEDISRMTGYEKRQLIRLRKELREKGMEPTLTHGNAGRKPSTTASDQEIEYLRRFKEPYPRITIAQFRDYFFEDVLQNPARGGDVREFGLKPRSASWFRSLFLREGWESPAHKRVRSDGDRVTHVVRAPRPRRGELVQIDGTPYDWFGDGRVATLFLAVDDATTEILAGYFMPTECTRGYCHVMKSVVDEFGVPMAVYSDKDTVFTSAKGGGVTQFGRMMALLGVEVILANSPQAKGRVERENNTVQLRLPNDIKRFGIKDYAELNVWFNAFYKGYLNEKFAFAPISKKSAFLPLPKDTDLTKVFRLEIQREVRKAGVSYMGDVYLPFEADGQLKVIADGTKVLFCIDAFSEEPYIERNGKRYNCECVKHGKREKKECAANQKDIDRILAEKDSKPE